MDSKNLKDSKIKIECTNESTVVEIVGHPLKLLTHLIAMFDKNEQVKFLMNTAIKMTDIIKKDPNFRKEKDNAGHHSYPYNAEAGAIMEDFAERYSNYIRKKD